MDEGEDKKIVEDATNFLFFVQGKSLIIFFKNCLCETASKVCVQNLIWWKHV